MAFVWSNHVWESRKQPGWPVVRNSRPCYIKCPATWFSTRLPFYLGIGLGGGTSRRPQQQVSKRGMTYGHQTSCTLSSSRFRRWLAAVCLILPRSQYHRRPLSRCHVYSETGEAFMAQEIIIRQWCRCHCRGHEPSVSWGTSTKLQVTLGLDYVSTLT